MPHTQTPASFFFALSWIAPILLGFSVEAFPLFVVASLLVLFLFERFFYVYDQYCWVDYGVYRLAFLRV